jgi:hypothetical protein
MNALPRYRRRPDAARYVREKWGVPCSSAWLAKLAVVGGGPDFRKIGRFPLYEDERLDAWVESRVGELQDSTSRTDDARRR